MNYFEVAIVSSKGQVVIPLAFRKRLGIRPGTKLMVLSDGHNLLLKPLAAPSLNPFRRLLKKISCLIKQERLTGRSKYNLTQNNIPTFCRMLECYHEL